MRILLIEDDGHLADSLAEILLAQRYIVDFARDGEAGWNQVSAIAYDLILLDVTLPKLDGMGLCRRMRDRGLTTPVLMLTARDTSSDKVMGLDAGADAYMVKPFHLEELLAQVRALLRRGQTSFTPVLSWGALSLDPAATKSATATPPFTSPPKNLP